MSRSPFSQSRRAWIIGTGSVALTAIAARLTYPAALRRGGRWVSEYIDGSTPSDEALRTVAEFTGVLMGRQLSPEHIRILVGRLAYNRKRSRLAASKYAELAAFADTNARAADHRVSGFVDAPIEVREQVMAEVMIGDLNTSRAKLAALFTYDGRSRWRIRNSTSIHLRTLYLRTPIPWQLRGYQGAPGAPANPREYTGPLIGAEA